MNTMRMGMLCALVGWMAADAQAQMGTYGAPDPIALGQYAPRDFSMPSAISRTSYATPVNGPGPALNGTIPPPPAAPGYLPQPSPPNPGCVPQPGSNYAPQPGPGYTPPPVPGYAPQPGSNYVPQPGPGNIPQPPSEAAAVSSMLNEPGPTVSPATGCNVMPQGGYIRNPGNCDTCGDACGGCCGGCGCCSPWYASFNALYMTRNQPNTVYTSAQSAAPEHQGFFKDENWTWGGQATVGYRFGCCCEWGVEGTYWGLSESCSDGDPGMPGPYVSPLTFGLTSILGTTGGLVTPLNPNGYQTANNYTDLSPVHHIWRNYDAQNVEFNFVRTVWGGDCNRFGVDLLAGIRWFRFQDGLLFGAQRLADNTAYANDWLYFDDRITNDLVGLQAGCNVSYRFTDCWRAFITPKFGVFNNYMTLDYNLYAVNGAGTHYQGSSQTYANPNYPVHATSDGFSFLTQVDLGFDWQITPHIATQFGYRVVAVTGMGLSDSQIPFFGNDTQAIAAVQHNDSLILHGVFSGVTFSW
jgi:hypothetical protein